MYCLLLISLSAITCLNAVCISQGSTTQIVSDQLCSSDTSPHPSALKRFYGTSDKRLCGVELANAVKKMSSFWSQISQKRPNVHRMRFKFG